MPMNLCVKLTDYIRGGIDMDERRLIRERFDCLNDSIENKTINEAINHLKNKKDEILKDPIYKSVEIALLDNGDLWSRSDKEYLYIVGIREENDKEYNARIKREKENREKQEKWDREQFIRLKKKYE